MGNDAWGRMQFVGDEVRCVGDDASVNVHRPMTTQDPLILSVSGFIAKATKQSHALHQGQTLLSFKAALALLNTHTSWGPHLQPGAQ